MDVLEEGRIAFYRRKGDRLLILLGDRLIVVGRKRLPNPRRREKFWAFVHRVGDVDLDDAKLTRESQYTIAWHDGHTHLIVDGSPELDFIVTVANPDPMVWGETLPAQRELFRDLVIETPTPFPPELQTRFGDRRYAELTPDFLDHPGAEIILMAVPGE